MANFFYFYLLSISLLVSINSPTYSQNINFVKEHGFWVGNLDTSRIGNYLVKDDWIYYFTTEGTPHSGYRYYFQIANIKDSIKNPIYLEYYSDQGFMVFHSLFKIGVGSYYDFAPNNRSTYQNFIIIDDILYLRDTEDYSFQFTLDGEYLGRFPYFSETHPEYADNYGDSILINDETILYPYNIFNIQYTSFHFVGNTVLLVSNDRITTVNKNDLNKNGNNAYHFDLLKEELDFNIELDRHSVVPLINNLFILHERDNVFLYKIEPELTITKQKILGNPKYIGNYAKFFYPYLYQTESPIQFTQILYRYKIEGLQETSSISTDLWCLYE